jgi:diguanylate cyclase (GGDEF)-like protein/PAS domain S-box-containing protein
MIHRGGQSCEMHDPDHLLRVTLQSIRDAVVVTDQAGRIVMLNASAEAMTGWSGADAIGKPVEAVIHLRESGLRESALRENSANDNQAGENDHEISVAIPACNDSHGASINESPSQAILIGKGGCRTAVQIITSPVNDPAGNFSGCVFVFHDVSEAFQMAERRSYLSLYDTLTGLPNRILLVDRMEQATKFADRRSDQMAVLAVDLDDFIHINSTYGQVIADELLKEAGYRMTAALRESDTVSRLGADDFVILLPGVKSIDDVEALATKILAAIAEPYSLGELSIRISCSMGVSLYPQDAIDADTLMRLADGALDLAKRSGRNKYILAGPASVTGAPASTLDISE